MQPAFILASVCIQNDVSLVNENSWGSVYPLWSIIFDLKGWNLIIFDIKEYCVYCYMLALTPAITQQDTHNKDIPQEIVSVGYVYCREYRFSTIQTFETFGLLGCYGAWVVSCLPNSYLQGWSSPTRQKALNMPWWKHKISHSHLHHI